jgi:hypothetical protein
MQAIRTSLGLGAIVVALGVVTNSFAAAPPSKKEHHHPITGVVVEVDHFKDKKGHGAIKVRVHDHAAKGTTTTANKGKNEHHVVTVSVTTKTHFEKTSHPGGQSKVATREVLAHFRDVEPGDHVHVKFDHGHHAEVVAIHVGKGKNKK